MAADAPCDLIARRSLTSERTTPMGRRVMPPSVALVRDQYCTEVGGKGKDCIIEGCVLPSLERGMWA